jgi:hypothetical protein
MFLDHTATSTIQSHSFSVSTISNSPLYTSVNITLTNSILRFMYYSSDIGNICNFKIVNSI